MHKIYVIFETNYMSNISDRKLISCFNSFGEAEKYINQKYGESVYYDTSRELWYPCEGSDFNSVSIEKYIKD